MMGARVAGSWADEIEAIASDEGITAAEVCRRAFGQYLGKQRETSTIQARVRKLEKQLDAVMAQVSTLMGVMTAMVSPGASSLDLSPETTQTRCIGASASSQISDLQSMLKTLMGQGF